MISNSLAFIAVLLVGYILGRIHSGHLKRENEMFKNEISNHQATNNALKEENKKLARKVAFFEDVDIFPLTDGGCLLWCRGTSISFDADGKFRGLNSKTHNELENRS